VRRLRILVTAAMVVWAVSCTLDFERYRNPSSTASGSSTICDAKGSCQPCKECAAAQNGPCNMQVLKCKENLECIAIDNCARQCPGNDGDCIKKCLDDHPAGKDAALSLDACFACTCTKSCNFTC
jgi:hypothetical protein